MNVNFTFCFVWPTLSLWWPTCSLSEIMLVFRAFSGYPDSFERLQVVKKREKDYTWITAYVIFKHVSQNPENRLLPVIGNLGEGNGSWFPKKLVLNMKCWMFSRRYFSQFWCTLLQSKVVWASTSRAYTLSEAVQNLWGPAWAEECNKWLSQEKKLFIQSPFPLTCTHTRTHTQINKQKTWVECICMSLGEVSTVCTWTQLCIFISALSRIRTHTRTHTLWLIINWSGSRPPQNEERQSQSIWRSLCLSLSLFQLESWREVSVNVHV